MKLSRVIKLKMYGDDVRFMQQKLKDFGFLQDKVDGFFGQNTLISVTNFQKTVNINPDGIVGSLTWNKLMNYNINITNNIIEQESDIPFEKSYIGVDGLIIYDCLLNDDEYIKSSTKKNTIWLHHTAGGSRPDWSIGGWEADYKIDKNNNKIPVTVGTSYVIGRRSSSTGDETWDGKILKAFDDKFWNYHLGISKKSLELNSKSIAIELCNYGPLVLHKDGIFYNYVNKPVMDIDVVKLDNPFRGYSYYEKYTNAQLEQTRKLIIYLINKHGIEINSTGKIDEKWFDYNEEWFKTGGIRSHSQVRTDKFDIFPQKEMIQMLNSI